MSGLHRRIVRPSEEVCRHQATAAIALLASRFANLGVRLHGFEVSTRGLGNFAADLVSFDSMGLYLAQLLLVSIVERGCTAIPKQATTRIALRAIRVVFVMLVAQGALTWHDRHWPGHRAGVVEQAAQAGWPPIAADERLGRW